MKKFISLLLCLVLIFSFAVPSFAYPHSDTEMEALNEIEYWTYWIHQDFTGFFTDTNDWLTSIWQVLTLSIGSNIEYIETDIDSIASNIVTLVSRSESTLSNLLDINEYLRSVNTEISSLNDNLFGNFSYLEPFAQVVQSNLSAMTYDIESFYQMQQYLLSDRWDFIEGSWWLSMYDDLHQLKEVLASDEDVLIRDNQNNNFASAISTIFSGDSSSFSIGGSDIVNTLLFTSYLSSYYLPDDMDTNVSSFLSNTSELINLSFMQFKFLDWFKDSTLNSLVTVPMTYTRDDPNAVVTHYYQDNMEFLTSIFGGDSLD